MMWAHRSSGRRWGWIYVKTKNEIIAAHQKEKAEQLYVRILHWVSIPLKRAEESSVHPEFSPWPCPLQYLLSVSILLNGFFPLSCTCQILWVRVWVLLLHSWTIFEKSNDLSEDIPLCLSFGFSNYYKDCRIQEEILAGVITMLL